MYLELAILALFVLLYSLVAARVDRTLISGPMVFVVAGFLMGPYGFGWLKGNAASEDLRVLADLTLAVVLFNDAATADLSVLKRQFRIPGRLLLIGLPGSILLGFGAAVLLFDGLSLFEAAILATMLAATDAALGKAVITNEAVPDRLRQGLNVESGLNDGICVPILLFFIALAVSSEQGVHSTSALALVAQELGIGLAAGVGLALVGTFLLRWCLKLQWVSKIWMQVTAVSLAISCFAVASSLHGSGYIAAFAGGMFFGPRGLASIVFAIMVINAGVPHGELLVLVVICTVFLSLVLHGMSANPLAAWLGNRENQQR